MKSWEQKKEPGSPLELGCPGGKEKNPEQQTKTQTTQISVSVIKARRTERDGSSSLLPAGEARRPGPSGRMREPPGLRRSGSRRSSARVGSPVVRVGPPASAGLGEAAAGRVIPAWLLSLVGTAYPFGSSPREHFGKRAFPRSLPARLLAGRDPTALFFPTERLGWKLAATVQPPWPVQAGGSGPCPAQSAAAGREQPPGSAAGRRPPAPGRGTRHKLPGSSEPGRSRQQRSSPRPAPGASPLLCTCCRPGAAPSTGSGKIASPGASFTPAQALPPVPK